MSNGWNLFPWRRGQKMSPLNRINGFCFTSNYNTSSIRSFASPVEPTNMEKDLKKLVDSVAKFCSNMEGTKVTFESSRTGGDDSIGKTNGNPYRMCVEGYIPSEKGSDRYRVCVDVGEKLLECVKAAISDGGQFSAEGGIYVG
ncbi:unnamed protein product [Microthlaspi erraticum]|uniref:Uncharacterized protein n=1 Tax=Microthlaspi erraticum TaxID=1685480 RepID=A0A6D2I849_9BRAS|nr:unnamed protein product [Microthlaspi erraticum]